MALRVLLLLSLSWTTLASAQGGRPDPLGEQLRNTKNPDFKLYETPRRNAPESKPEPKLKRSPEDSRIEQVGNRLFWKRDYACDGETYALVYVEYLTGRGGIEYVQLCNEKKGNCVEDRSEQTLRCREQAKREFGRSTSGSNTTAPQIHRADLDTGSASS